MREYLKVPPNLTLELLRKEFGGDAVAFYQSRLRERMNMGRIYRNPLKTIWLWATEDRKTNQGYWTSYCGHTRRRGKNHGGS